MRAETKQPTKLTNYHEFVANKPYILRDICALNSVKTAPFKLCVLPVLGVYSSSVVIGKQIQN